VWKNSLSGMAETYASEANGLDDDDMAGLALTNRGLQCGIPSLAACTGIQELELECLGLSFNSCAALGVISPQMAALLKLSLKGNSIDDDCVQVLVRGLVQCRHLYELNLNKNLIGDNGLELLVQGLPTSVDSLELSDNEVTLSRQLPLSRFKALNLGGNELSSVCPRVIAASLADPECRLETLYLDNIGIGDEENRLEYIFDLLCDTANINATHGSNHTLGFLGHVADIPQGIKMLLELNSDQDKSCVAAKKILLTNRHLDMRPLFDWEFDLLPYMVTWLDRFAESLLDLKLSSIFQFVRAMPVDFVDKVTEEKGQKCCRNSLWPW
ncbi:hypothetical protein THAOC_01984, partial [Thalassiosira oceanica]